MQPDFDKTAAAMVAGTEKAIAAAVAPLLRRIETLEARPLPERGEKGEAGDRGHKGEPGRDGVGLAGALIDRSGVLVLTLTDGTTRELGVVVGKDGADGSPGEKGERGEPGERGESGPMGEPGGIGPAGEKGMDGRDGRDGTNGRDGFSLEDFDVEAGEDGRTVTLKFEQGDVRHCYELVFPVVLDRGVFKAGETYQPGDAVTWGGSLWIAQKETGEKPDAPDSGFRLAVKRGRDGKDGAK